jgi:hypothetical protein
LFTFLYQPSLDATNWRAELAIRFGVILRKVWRGSRTWAGVRAQAVLMSVWRTCWQQGHSALDFLSQRLQGTPVPLALPRDPPQANPRCSIDPFVIACLRIKCPSKYPLVVGGFALLSVVFALLGWWQLIVR